MIVDRLSVQSRRRIERAERLRRCRKQDKTGKMYNTIPTVIIIILYNNTHVYIYIHTYMCQSLPEITGDGTCVCASSARVFEYARVDVCTSYSVRTLRTSSRRTLERQRWLTN